MVALPKKRKEEKKGLVMRKLFLMLAVLLVASAAYAADVTISCTADGNVVTVSYSAIAEANIPRAFALDIRLSTDATITDVTPLDPNYWVYPGSYGEDPCTPVGDPCDSDDTLPGEDSNGITIEMASLHSPTGSVANPNAPEPNNALLSFKVSGSDDCNVYISGNAARGKVVFYDATNEDDGRDVVYTGCEVVFGGCPTCPGDLDGDNDYDLDDFSALKGKLVYAKYLTGEYLILPDDPTTGFLWDECGDMMTQDNDIDLDDFSALKGKLVYAKYLTGEYLVEPDDPTTGFLWDCP